MKLFFLILCLLQVSLSAPAYDLCILNTPHEGSDCEPFSSSKFDKPNKPWNLGGGYGFFQIPSHSAQFSGPAFSVNFFLIPSIGFEYGLISAKETAATDNKAQLTHYGIIFNLLPNLEKWEWSITAQSTSISNSLIRNKLAGGGKMGYQLNSIINIEFNLLAIPYSESGESSKTYLVYSALIAHRF